MKSLPVHHVGVDDDSRRNETFYGDDFASFDALNISIRKVLEYRVGVSVESLTGRRAPEEHVKNVFSAHVVLIKMVVSAPVMVRRSITD